MVAVININVVTCPLSTQTPSCIMLSLWHYLDADFM